MIGSEKQVAWALKLKNEFFEKAVGFETAIKEAYEAAARYEMKTGTKNEYKEELESAVSKMDELKSLVGACTSSKLLIANGGTNRWASITSATNAVVQRDYDQVEKDLSLELKWIKK